MADYLLEIGTEEIPAKFMPGAMKQMEEATTKALQEKRISFTNIRAMGTPRRLSLLITGIAEKGKDISEEVRGPAKRSAFDASGNPTKAVEGFARGQGVSIESIIVKELNGNEYVFANKQVQGQDTASVLPEIIENMIRGLYFPKPMRWGNLEFRFARPIRWIVSMLNDQVLPFNLAGVTAGCVSRGHRFLGTQSINISTAKNYEAELEAQFVIVDPQKRQAKAWQQIQEIASANNLVVAQDEELIEEVTYLIEWPTALMGSFKEGYLEIPEEVIITPMREHQRYFPVRDQAGKLLNRFVTVRNGGDHCLDVVQAGNEKVLAARLADARFFWDEDRKKPLEALLPRLGKVVFQEKLGTIEEKVQRIEGLTTYLTNALKVSAESKAVALRAAKLCKADLVSNMVCEFTELQGIMGQYYAEESGEKPQVAQAILEHYQPRFAQDGVASSVAGALVAIADKMDSITGIFAIGIEPSGSQDPYALRRAAMGICQTVVTHNLKLDLDKLINQSLDQYSFILTDDEIKKTIHNKVKDFFAARLRNILADNGNRYDVIEASMAVNWQFLQEVIERSEAISALREDPDFMKLMEVFTRANNLAKKGNSWVIEPSLLIDPCEIKLFQAIQHVQNNIEQTISQLGIKGMIHLLSELADPINKFFENVMVMAKEEEVRANRLALLNTIVEMSRQAGDLSKLTNQG